MVFPPVILLSSRLWGKASLGLVLCVDGLYLLPNELCLVLDFLHLAVHLVDKAVALLAACVEETEIVLVGLHLLLQLLVASHQPCALIVKSLLATFGNLLQVAPEVVQTSSGIGDVHFAEQLVYDVAVIL